MASIYEQYNEDHIVKGIVDLIAERGLENPITVDDLKNMKLLANEIMFKNEASTPTPPPPTDTVAEPEPPATGEVATEPATDEVEEEPADDTPDDTPTDTTRL